MPVKAHPVLEIDIPSRLILHWKRLMLEFKVVQMYNLRLAGLAYVRILWGTHIHVFIARLCIIMCVQR